LFFKFYNSWFKTSVSLEDFGISGIKNPQIKDSIQINFFKVSEDDYIKYSDNQTQISDEYGYYYSGKNAFFEFLNGNEIRVNYFSAIDEDLLHVLLNYPIGAILFQRDCYVMHASAVNYRGLTLCFCGKTMSGKSSFVAYLISEGGKLVSEDTCIFDAKKDLYLSPSYPFIKISKKISSFVNLDFEKKIILNKKNTDRIGYKLPKRMFYNKPTKVDYFIFLSWCRNDDNLIELSREDSFKSLLENNFFSSISQEQSVFIFENSISLLKETKFLNYKRRMDYDSFSNFNEMFRKISNNEDL